MPLHSSLVLSLLVLFLTSCATSSTLRQRRLEANPQLMERLSAADRSLVEQGKIREGMRKEAVFLSWGRPDEIRQGSKRKVPYETWHYTGHRAYSQSHLSLGYDVYPHYRHRGYRGGYYGYPYFLMGPAVTTTYVPVRTGTVEFLNDKVVSWEARKR